MILQPRLGHMCGNVRLRQGHSKIDSVTSTRKFKRPRNFYTYILFSTKYCSKLNVCNLAIFESYKTQRNPQEQGFYLNKVTAPMTRYCTYRYCVYICAKKTYFILLEKNRRKFNFNEFLRKSHIVDTSMIYDFHSIL